MPSPANSPRVAVIGGGIIGLAVAWKLAAGGAEVELFERGELAGAATRVAAGMLAPVSEADPAEPMLLALGLESARAWPAFADELAGIGGGSASSASANKIGADDDAAKARVPARPANPLIRTDGTLLVARDADEGRWLEREAALRTAQGLACELLTPTQARALEPDLAPGLRGALHVPGDHAVDPRRIATALAAAANAAGATLFDHEPLSGLTDPRLDHVDRIVVCSGAWPIGRAKAAAPTVVGGATVNAAGAGDHAAGASAGNAAGATVATANTAGAAGTNGAVASRTDRSLTRGARDTEPTETDTHPVKGQLLVLRDPDHDTRGEPIVRHTLRGYSVYLVPRGDGRYIVGATMEHRGYDTTVTAWAVHDLLRELFEVVPATREFVIEETLAGLRPATASGDPLIGPAPGDPAGDDARVLYAIGHYRNGVLLAPITAQRIAALVLGV